MNALARINRDIETDARALEFAKLYQFAQLHGGLSNAATAAQGSTRDLGPKLGDIVKSAAGGISRELLKAAQSAGTLVGQPLADYSAISAAFINSLVNASAFDQMLSSMTPVPLGTGTVGAVTVGATAYSISEGSAKPISRLSIANQQMNPLKVMCAIPFTQELRRSAIVGAAQLMLTELKNATALVTDQAFVNALLSGISPITSSGSTGESIRSDIAGLLRSISPGQNSKLFLLVPSLVCKMWSMASNAKGQSAFELLGPLGGEINKIPVIATDGCPTGTAVLVDASGVCAAPGEAAFQDIKEGSLQQDTVPDSPASPSTAYISMWQTNSVATVVERFFCAVRIRSDAVASVFSSSSWQGGNSPP